MDSRRRRQLQRSLLALAGLLAVVLIGVLGAHRGSTTAVAGGVAAAIAACLLAAGLLPSDAPRLRPPAPGAGGRDVGMGQLGGGMGMGQLGGMGMGGGMAMGGGMGMGGGAMGISGVPDPRVAELAAENGWTYSPADDAVTRPLLRPPLVAGGGEYDVVTGSVEGVAFTSFSYGVRIGPGRPPVFRVVAISLPATMAPLAVGPDRLLRPMTSVLGLPDVDIESESFNRHFKVLCRDRRYAVAMLTPRTIESMQTSESFCWRIDGDVLLSWDESLVDPDTLPDRIRQITSIVRFAPAFVWEQFTQPA